MSSEPSWRKLIAIVVLLTILIGIPSFLLLKRAKAPVDRDTRLAFTWMTSDLRGLIVAEEATKRMRGHYLTDSDSAGQLSSPGVTKPVIVLSDTGWSATVQYKPIPGIRCAVGVYNRNPLKRFAKSGEIVCE